MMDLQTYLKALFRMCLIYWAIMAELGFLGGMHAWQRLGF